MTTDDAIEVGDQMRYVLQGLDVQVVAVRTEHWHRFCDIRAASGQVYLDVPDYYLQHLGSQSHPVIESRGGSASRGESASRGDIEPEMKEASARIETDIIRRGRKQDPTRQMPAIRHVTTAEPVDPEATTKVYRKDP